MPNILNASSKKNQPDALSVSELTNRIRGRLEGEFRNVRVEGEISTWSVAGSGHVYFSIKDEGSLLSCVMWRSALSRLPFQPSEGMKVQCIGNITVFNKRGQYQLQADSMIQAGLGDLWVRFQALKARLEGEGLFAQERKRPLPRYPRSVGVVTSPTGAAVRDIINVMTRRAPSVSILIYPSRVQGDGAGAEIAHATQKLAHSGRVEAVIIGRGGGSTEDLWEFNDEGLARVIYNSPVPIISAVGHEVDFSISDFVADLRAATPSAAAEIITAGYMDLRDYFLERISRIERNTVSRIREARMQVEGMLSSHALGRPEMMLREFQQRVDSASDRLPELVQHQAERLRSRLERLTGSIEGHNPELILSKGYAIVRRSRDEKVLMSAEKLKKNLPVSLQMKDGTRSAVVTDDEAPDLFG